MKHFLLGALVALVLYGAYLLLTAVFSPVLPAPPSVVPAAFPRGWV